METVESMTKLINLPPHHRDQQLPPAPQVLWIPEHRTCRDKQKKKNCVLIYFKWHTIIDVHLHTAFSEFK